MESSQASNNNGVSTPDTTSSTSSTPAVVHHDNDHHRHGNCHKHSRSYKDPRRELHPSTAVIMAGYRSDLSESAIKAPLFRTSTFEFTSAAAGERFFQRAYHLAGDDGEKPGLIYSRLNNPNTEILEDKMVALEKGSNYASAFPSGMSAISTTIMALVESGGHIIYVSTKNRNWQWNAASTMSAMSNDVSTTTTIDQPCLWRYLLLSQTHVSGSFGHHDTSGRYQ